MSNQITEKDVLTRKLMQIGKVFRLPGQLCSFQELKNGNINQTYQLNYSFEREDGSKEFKSYLAQKINTVAFKNPIGLMENIDRVTTHLKNKNPNSVSLHFHHTEDGKNFFMEADGFWRLSNFIPSVTFNRGENLKVVENTGIAFGNFQMLLSDFDASKLHFTIPNFHDTRLRYQNLKTAMQFDRCQRLEECKSEVEWLLSVEDDACQLIDLYHEGKLPLRVTHNDTKINNVLFEKSTFEPLVVIDLDTVMPGVVGNDFGDAIRFASNTVEEDCEDLSKVHFDRRTYEAFATGFLSRTSKVLTKIEVETLGISCFALTVECAVRFLEDYINGDIYFKISKEKHNLIRAKKQIQLAKEMQTELSQMTDICLSLFNQFKK